MDNSAPVLLQADNIGRLASRSEQWLIRDVTLALSAGERVSLVGPSGSGKSVLLRALALLDPLDEGQLLWHGQPIGCELIPQYRSKVIYLHQRPALVEGSVLDNLLLPFGYGVHKGRQPDHARIQRWLELLGRGESFLGKRSRDLSGGEQQITAPLRAMQLQPELLLLDEPTAALDQAATSAVEQCVQQWFQEDPGSRCFLVVSHNHQQVRRMVDRELVIQVGRLV